MKALFLLSALLLPFALGAKTPPPVIQTGDSNADFQVCMDDAIVVIYHLFRDGRPVPCPDAADADRDGTLGTTDIVLILRHIFHGEILPDCPISCGQPDGGYYYE